MTHEPASNLLVYVVATDGITEHRNKSWGIQEY